MARAILDMPLPQNCYECPLRCRYRRKWFCQIIMHVALLDQRRPDCPLKPVEDKEKHGKWVLHGNDDDLGMTYYCSVCGFGLDEDLFYSGYKDGEWIRNHVFKHCPNCGTKMDE